MDIATMTEFFKCCSIINISIFTISSIIIMTTDLGYSVHTKLGLWEGSKEAHKQSMYSILGNFNKYRFIIKTLIVCRRLWYFYALEKKRSTVLHYYLVVFLLQKCRRPHHQPR